MPPARRSARTASSTAARETAGPYTRANRPPSPNSTRPTASITRGANGSSLKLKVKAPSSKLKQVTGASDGAIPPNPYADLSESDATPQSAARTARQTRKPRTVVEPDSDEDMEDADGEEQEEEEEDMEGDEEEEEGEDEEEGSEDSEEDAAGEEEDDEDELASDSPPPPPPIIRQERPPGKIKPNVTVTAPPEGPVKSVEAKEMEDEEDEEEEEEEEELSELQSNPEGDEDEEDEDSDEDLDNSRSATPDVTKLTKRQRGAHGVVETENDDLMELSNEAQKKKHLTAEEQVMRRAEMARRRKNLSEKRNEEEKARPPLALSL